jgi:3-dehydroquinate synthetase
VWELIRERGNAALADGAEADLAARHAMVERSAVLKLGVVDRDPFEAGERRTLNLGHTIGHALEIESRYALPHGQPCARTRAVAHMALARGLAEPALAAEIDDVVASLASSRTGRSTRPS